MRCSLSIVVRVRSRVEDTAVRRMRFESTSRFAPPLAALATAAVGIASWPYTVDDGPPTDGITGPLWIVPGVLARWVGADPIAAAKIVGIACAAIAVALL